MEYSPGKGRPALSICFGDLHYSVAGEKGNSISILHGVNGVFLAGKMTAVVSLCFLHIQGAMGSVISPLHGDDALHGDECTWWIWKCGLCLCACACARVCERERLHPYDLCM